MNLSDSIDKNNHWGEILMPEVYVKDYETDEDDMWLKEHMEEVMEKYAHKIIAILDKEIVAIGGSIREVSEETAKEFPHRIPLIFEVPEEEEFQCLL